MTDLRAAHAAYEEACEAAGEDPFEYEVWLTHNQPTGPWDAGIRALTAYHAILSAVPE